MAFVAFYFVGLFVLSVWLYATDRNADLDPDTIYDLAFWPVMAVILAGNIIGELLWMWRDRKESGGGG